MARLKCTKWMARGFLPGRPPERQTDRQTDRQTYIALYIYMYYIYNIIYILYIYILYIYILYICIYAYIAVLISCAGADYGPCRFSRAVLLGLGVEISGFSGFSLGL